MLLSDAVRKYFPELVTPDLTRKKSKSHWRKNRNKTGREKAAARLVEKKGAIITKELIHKKEQFPILEISDDETDIWVAKEYDILTMDITTADLLSHDIEMVGDFHEEELIVLLENLIDQLAHSNEIIH